jgi:hypothetical protein
MFKKLFIAFFLPVISIIVVLLLSYSCKKWENPLIAAGTVGAAVSAIWAVIFLEIIKPYFDRPKLEVKEPGFEHPFYRQAPEINEQTGQPVGMGYYINLLLINKGNRTANNCQPLLTSMWIRIENRWEHKKNWIPVALKWAMGEDDEYVQDIQRAGIFKKIREERNLIPIRPYYFNLGCISTAHADMLRILQVRFLTAQSDTFGPGEYCFEITVTGEEVKPLVKYIKVRWDGGCTEKLNEVERKIFVSMHEDSPCKN